MTNEINDCEFKDFNGKCKITNHFANILYSNRGNEHCDNLLNCYYKQLQALKEENKRLREALEKISKDEFLHDYCTGLCDLKNINMSMDCSQCIANQALQAEKEENNEQN